jgi:hypothetical protein
MPGPGISVHQMSAGLTSVVKFKNYGVDSVECADDGSGISPHDYDGIGTLQSGCTDEDKNISPPS